MREYSVCMQLVWWPVPQVKICVARLYLYIILTHQQHVSRLGNGTKKRVHAPQAPTVNVCICFYAISGLFSVNKSNDFLSPVEV